MKGFAKGKFVQAMEIAGGPLEIDEAAMGKELEAAAESAPNPSCPGRHGSDLAVVSRVEDNDPVRFPEIVASNNDRLARFEPHAGA